MVTKDDQLRQAQAELDAALNKRRVAWEMWIKAGQELEMVRLKIARLADEKKI